MKKKKSWPETGPRGGRTTITKNGMRRVGVFLAYPEWQELRRRVYEENCSGSAILRKAIRDYCDAQPKAAAAGKRRP